MGLSIILGHPNPQSFNHALADEVRGQLLKMGHSIFFHDLYREGFDPVLPSGEEGRGASLPPLVRQHCDEIGQAERIVRRPQLAVGSKALKEFPAN